MSRDAFACYPPPFDLNLVQVPSSLLSKPLCIAVFVRDRMTGDALSVTVTSSQQQPLELLPGTTTFEEGECKFGASAARPGPIPRGAGQIAFSLTNVPVDESVCCVVEVSDASTLALLSWYHRLLLSDCACIFQPHSPQVLLADIREKHDASAHSKGFSASDVTIGQRNH
jgi:hypothetical protein